MYWIPDFAALGDSCARHSRLLLAVVIVLNAGFVVPVSLLADLMYAVLDPRIWYR